MKDFFNYIQKNMDFDTFYNKWLPEACPHKPFKENVLMVDVHLDDDGIIRFICWHLRDKHIGAHFEYDYSEKVKDLHEIHDSDKVKLRIFNINESGTRATVLKQKKTLSDEDKKKLNNIIKKIDLKKADIKFAWGIAHKPELRAILTDRPLATLIESKTWDDNPDSWQSALILAIMYIGREREIGKLLPEPEEGMTAEEFVRSCYN